MSPPGNATAPRGNEGPESRTHTDILILEPRSDNDALFSPDTLRDLGMEVVEAASSDQGIAVVDQAIRSYGEMYGEVDANSIRDVLPNERPALIGSRFLALARQGKLAKIGYTRATHAAGHGRMIARWRWCG